MQKYGFDDARDVLERASARETAARVVAGALAKALLATIGVAIVSHVIRIGEAATPSGPASVARRPRASSTTTRFAASTRRARGAMVAEIKAAAKVGDSLGGIVEVIAYGVPGRTRQPRPLGSQTRRTARGCSDEHPGRQGGRDR